MNVKKRKRFVGTICLMLSMVLLDQLILQSIPLVLVVGF